MTSYGASGEMVLRPVGLRLRWGRTDRQDVRRVAAGTLDDRYRGIAQVVDRSGLFLLQTNHLWD